MPRLLATETHCANGHEFTPDNTYTYPSGKRACMTCRCEASRKHSGRPPLSEVPRGTWNRNKIQCPKGHLYTADNTYFVHDKSGQHRKCVTCERDRQLKFKYGITQEEYDALLEAQGGGCAVCGATPEEEELPVDHDHDTGEVRGILCNNCNNGIGRFEDSPELLRSAADYLEGANADG